MTKKPFVEWGSLASRLETHFHPYLKSTYLVLVISRVRMVVQTSLAISWPLKQENGIGSHAMAAVSHIFWDSVMDVGGWPTTRSDLGIRGFLLVLRPIFTLILFWDLATRLYDASMLKLSSTDMAKYCQPPSIGIWFQKDQKWQNARTQNAFKCNADVHGSTCLKYTNLAWYRATVMLGSDQLPNVSG